MDNKKASLILRTCAIVALVWCCVSATSPAWADEAADARQAATLYREGRYDEASVLYARLSVSYPKNMAYLWNLGACYYYSIRADQAISTLRQYIAEDVTVSSDDRKMAEQWIAEMEARKRTAEAPVIGAPSTVLTVPVAPSTSGPDNASIRQNADIPIASDEANATPTWIAAGVGAVGLLGGVVFTVMAQDRFSSTERQYDTDTEASGRTFAKLQAIGYTVGLGGLVTAAFLHWREKPEEQKVFAMPIVSNTVTGLGVGATF